jgi:hypothetical protein
MGQQIDPLLDRYRTAVERKAAARALAEKLCPAIPDDIVCKRDDRLTFAGCTDREVDVEGKEIWPPNYVGADGKTYAHAPRQILKAELIEQAIARGNLYAAPRSKIGKHLRKLIEIAKKYEAEREAAIEHSGIQIAIDDLLRAATSIDFLAYEVRKIEPVTMTGVLIQVRALAAHNEAELIVCGPGRAGAVLGPKLAAAVLCIGGTRGAA